LKDTRYYPLEKYRRSRRGRKWNKYTFGLYIYIYFSIPSPLPLSLCRIHSLSVTPSHTPPPTISHSFCLHRRLLLHLTRSLCFIFILYIDTKLSPPVNKYRQQWPPKGGSFSYFNASSWSYPSTILHAAVHVYTTRLFVHYAFTGQCRGSKRSSRSSVHFFSHFFIYSLLFFFCKKFSRAMYTSLPHSTPPAHRVLLFTQSQAKSYKLLCVFGSALLQNLSRATFVSARQKAAQNASATSSLVGQL